MGWGLASWPSWPEIASWPDIAFWLTYAAWAAVLSHRDIALRRLPDALTLPALPVAVAAAVAGGEAAAFALGSAMWAGTYAVTGVVTPRAMGGGDVKLALVLGGLAGWSGGALAVAAAMAGAGLLTAAAGTVAAIVRGGRGKRRGPAPGEGVPHGPSMLLACAGAMLGGPLA